MEEQLISFETAKLAEEKGFPQRNNDKDLHSGFICEKCWVCDLAGNKSVFSNSNAHAAWAAPTQSLLQKWLREVHHIHISVEVTDIDTIKYFLYIYDKREFDSFDYFYSIYGMETKVGVNNKEFISYEEALEVGLQEALKLIKI
jgi:hypothetical protein